MNAKCDNCGLVVDEADLNPIKKLYERVSPGEAMPSGECPQCGALAHPTKQKVKPIKLRLTLEVTYNHHGELTSNLEALLNGIVERATNDGLMTGECPAEVENWKSCVEEIK